jgi:hypothetical protein
LADGQVTERWPSQRRWSRPQNGKPLEVAETIAEMRNLIGHAYGDDNAAKAPEIARLAPKRPQLI